MALLQRALAPRAEERFSSATDFKKELDKLLYGGAYSPTTFNLALFMDRLFRSEIDIEERERAAEAGVSVEPYLPREPKPAPVERDLEFAATTAEKRPVGVWIGVAAGVILAGVIGAWLLGRGGGSSPTDKPTPTAQEPEATKAADAARLKEMVETGAAAPDGGEGEGDPRRAHDPSGQDRRAAEEAERPPADHPWRRRERRSEAKPRGAPATDGRRAGRQTGPGAQARGGAPARPRGGQAEGRCGGRGRCASHPAPPRRGADPGPGRAHRGAGGKRPTEPDSGRGAANPQVGGSRGRRQGGGCCRRRARRGGTQLSSSVPPKYPPAAQRLQAKGEVTLQLLVGVDGSVEQVRILKVTREGLDFEKASEEAARQWRYRPATKDGVRVKMWITVRIPFVLK